MRFRVIESLKSSTLFIENVVAKKFVSIVRRFHKTFFAKGIEYIGGAVIAVTAIIGGYELLRDLRERDTVREMEAWNTISSAAGESGNLGREAAIKILMRNISKNNPLAGCIGPHISFPFWSKKGNENTGYVNLSGAPLQNAYLPGVNLSYAFLYEAKFMKATMPEVQMVKSNLQGADLSGAYLSWGDFRGACLKYAKLRNATLGKAMLENADLTGADLEGADLKNADVYHANFTDTKNFSCNQLRSAKNWQDSYNSLLCNNSE